MKNYFLVLTLLLTSCAHYQPGIKAKHKDGELIKGLTASAEIDDELSNRYFKFLNVTFGNKGPGWIRIKSLKLKNPESEFKGKINIILGEDLNVWSQSMTYVRQIQSHNLSVLTGIIASTAMVAGAVAGSKGNTSGANLGFGVAMGALSVNAVNSIVTDKNNLERGLSFPDGHIYKTFSIPAGLYNKRWILLEFEDANTPKKLTFEIELLDGRKTTYDFPLEEPSMPPRKPYTKNKWKKA